MDDLAGPWACHVLVVFLAAYVLGRCFRSPLLAAVAATAVGVGFAFWLGAYQPVGDGWLVSNTYAKLIYGFRTVSRDPMEFLGAFIFCWIAPIAVASLTVWWRSCSKSPAPESSGS